VTPLWGERGRSAEPTGHSVQIYEHVSELAEVVADYLAAGFAAGEPAILIATEEHRVEFLEALDERGCDFDEGDLTMLDARETLGRILEGDRPSAERFQDVVGGAIEAVGMRCPGRKIRAFGEMVDVLFATGRREAADELEKLWNDLASTGAFSLLCAYRLDLFDRSTQASPLPRICESHTHVVPAADVSRLTRAVDYALETVLGPARTVNVYLSAQRQFDVEAPLPQLALMWVSTHMPDEADRVLSVARERYAGAVIA
jgi:KaiC/GvpD/RAD55 family RecA-like ATPase